MRRARHPTAVSDRRPRGRRERRGRSRRRRQGRAPRPRVRTGRQVAQPADGGRSPLGSLEADERADQSGPSSRAPGRRTASRERAPHAEREPAPDAEGEPASHAEGDASPSSCARGRRIPAAGARLGGRPAAAQDVGHAAASPDPAEGRLKGPTRDVRRAARGARRALRPLGAPRQLCAPDRGRSTPSPRILDPWTMVVRARARHRPSLSSAGASRRTRTSGSATCSARSPRRVCAARPTGSTRAPPTWRSTRRGWRMCRW